jgi:hypothetical protein
MVINERERLRSRRSRRDKDWEVGEIKIGK